MKTFYVEFKSKGEIKAEIVSAATATQAVKVVCDKIRERNRPVKIELVKVKTL